MERIKGFFQSLTLKQIVWSSITIGCILLYGILTLWMNHETRGLVDQQGAVRWDSEGDSAQVSCYFEEHVEITKNEFIGFEKTLEKMLKEVLPQEDYAEENDKRLVVDAYSAMGTISITSKKGKMDNVAAIGIGGDFFLFHPVQLLEGGYFSGDDLMQDSILLDEDGAWQLFGSSDIVGQSVMIGGIPHYVAGVFERADGRFAEDAGLDKPIVFVSEETLSQHGTTKGISSYEVIAPNPVKRFVYNAVKEKLGVKETDMVVVENSARYSLESLLTIIFDFGTRSMRKTAVHFPYWENIARGYEDISAFVLLFRLLFLLMAGIIVMVFLIVKWKNRKFSWKDIRNYLSDKREQLRSRTWEEKKKWEQF